MEGNWKKAVFQILALLGGAGMPMGASGGGKAPFSPSTFALTLPSRYLNLSLPELRLPVRLEVPKPKTVS